MTTDVPTHQMILERLGPGRWRVPAGEEWRNPSGGLWGGYAIGLATRIIQAEPERVGEVLSLTLTYAAALPAGDLDVRTRRIRQGGSVGVWEVELRPPGSEEVGVHAIVTTAKRPDTPPFAFVTMPEGTKWDRAAFIWNVLALRS